MPLNQILRLVESEKVSVVCFDVFNTLLLRPLFYSDDIYVLLGRKIGFQDFPSAVSIAKKHLIEKDGLQKCDITSEKIFNVVEHLFPSKFDAKAAIAAEEELYENICTVRKSMKEVLERALELEKEIALVTDYPISRNLLKKILQKNGISGYRDIYIAHENGCAKSDGGLFKLICKEFCDVISSPSDILYFTTVYDYDMKSAAKVGITSKYIPSPIAAMKKCRKLGELFNNYSVKSDNGFLIAHAANLIFDDPTIVYSNDSYFNNSIDNFSIFSFAPLVLTFTKWMLDDCEKSHIENLCYVYRDGYLVEKIHDLLNDYYKGIGKKKIYITRAIANVFCGRENNGFNESINNFLTSQGMTRDIFIKTRLFAEEDTEEYIEATEIFKNHGIYFPDDIITRDSFFKYANEFEEVFHKGAAKRLGDAVDYINSVIGDCGKTAVFDVGYRGSACRLLKKHFNFDTVGYHFFAKEMIKNANSDGLDVRFPILIGLFDEQKTTVIQVLTEDLLNAQEASVVRVKKEGKDFVLVRDENNSFSELIDDIQKKCVSFSESFISMFGKDFKSFDFDILSYYEFYRRILEKMSKSDVDLFNNIKFVDSTFMNPNAENMYKKWHNRVYGIKPVNSAVATDNSTKIVKVNEEQNYSDFRIKTYLWLKDHGILAPFRFVWRCGRKIKQAVLRPFVKEKISLSGQKVIDDFERSISNIKETMSYRIKPTVIFCGHNAAFDKGSCDYINRVAAMDTSNHYIFISEAPHVKKSVLLQKIRIESKVLPFVSMANDYHSNIDMPFDQSLNNFIKSKPFLEEAAKNMKARFLDMGKNYEDYLTKFLYDYYNTLIDLYTQNNMPLLFIVWNEFTAMHTILRNVCMERKIPVLFFEFGVIPGTFCLESGGQMGESHVACKSEEFCSLPICDEDLNKASQLISYLKSSGLNRNPQPINSLVEDYRAKLDMSKPTVLYLGQNDFESGIYPYNKTTKTYHSPLFKSSKAAALELERICKKKGWNYIYKPHPSMMLLPDCNDGFAKSTIIAGNANINDLIDISTVTITILSQAAYVSLIREKPVVMLGYNQLKGKKCTYECSSRSNIESLISQAIANGYSEEQRSCFVKHVALLNKYYLFYDLRKNGGIWGRDIQQFVDYIQNSMPESQPVRSDQTNKMKIAVIASMPANYYSGGRSHAWNVAECLSFMGNTVYFISQNLPIFKDAIKEGGVENHIDFIQTKDFIVDIPDVDSLDYVIIAPHRDRNEQFYFKARNFAIKMNAKLVLINYESGNWANKYLNNELPDELWGPWKNVCKDGCLILSSDIESMKYAKDYYLVNPRHTVFDYWYPPVNTVAADSIPDVEKQNQITALIRLNDKYKGSYDILEMIDESLRGYKLVLIYGSGIMDERYANYVRELERLKNQYGIDFEIKVQLTDAEKFAEIKKSKYLLFPSYFEGYGTPPIEAQYCNTICLAYDLPVLRETAGKGIVFCEYGNPSDMKSKLAELIEHNITYSDLKESVEEYARFDICAAKLDKLLRRHIDEEWRDPSAKMTQL